MESKTIAIEVPDAKDLTVSDVYDILEGHIECYNKTLDGIEQFAKRNKREHIAGMLVQGFIAGCVAALVVHVGRNG